MWKVNEGMLRHLRGLGCVFSGSTSVTLVKVDDVSEFVSSSLKEKEKRMIRRKTEGTKRSLIEESEIAQNLVLLHDAKP